MVPPCTIKNPFVTVIEPFRIKSVEPIKLTTLEDRERHLREAFFNTFLLKSEHILIDFLTDSGTCSMSCNQWAAMMTGDESYAGASSWTKFEAEVHDLTGYPYILPTHQGRAGERILYDCLLSRPGSGRYFFSNTFFDTTRANIEFRGGIAVDCPTPDCLLLTEDRPYKGNADVDAMWRQMQEVGLKNVGGVCLTLTNNTQGGQPVSLQNVRDVSALCQREGIPFILDACRIAENSYFIHVRDPECHDMSCRSIAQKIFSLADGCIMSAKKDGLANAGGFLALRDKQLAEECSTVLIISEGFLTYGGLAGRDLEAIAVGLREVFDEDYLHYRITSTTYLGKELSRVGIPVMLPIGGHAVYVDAKQFYPHIPVEQFPGQVLACEVYRQGGVRCCEVGSVMFGKHDADGNLVPASRELVRLALPRRVYTQSHFCYVVEVFEQVWKTRFEARGLEITYELKFLRHFTAHFRPVEDKGDSRRDSVDELNKESSSTNDDDQSQ